jgi:hypothetical protein
MDRPGKKFAAPANLLTPADCSLGIDDGATQSYAGQSYSTLGSESGGQPSTTPTTALEGPLSLSGNFRSWKSVVKGIGEESDGVSMESPMYNESSVCNQASRDLPVRSPGGSRLHNWQIAQMMKVLDKQEMQQKWQQAHGRKLAKDCERAYLTNSGLPLGEAARQYKQYDRREQQLIWEQVNRAQNPIRTAQNGSKLANLQNANWQRTGLSISAPQHTHQPINVGTDNTYSPVECEHSNTKCTDIFLSK